MKPHTDDEDIFPIKVSKREKRERERERENRILCPLHACIAPEHEARKCMRTILTCAALFVC